MECAVVIVENGCTARVLVPVTALAVAPLTFFCKSVVAAIADTAN